MNLKSLKTGRNKFFVLLTAILVVISVVLNLLFTYLGQKYTLFVDSTPEGLYSPSDAFIKECEFLDEIAARENGATEIKIIFCADPDVLVESSSTRATYYTVKRLASVYKNLKVETVDVNTNPTAVAMYKATSLSKISPSDIIFAYGDSYRIINAQKMWTKGRNSGTLYGYNGEYRIAGLLKSVTAIDMPTAYFLVGHGETYFDPETKYTYDGTRDGEGNLVPVTDKSRSLESFAALLLERGLQVKLLDLSVTKCVPDDCALLVINNPTEDFTYEENRLDELAYVSELEMLDRYLVKNQGAIMVNKDYATTLSNFENFLYEWGFGFDNAVVKDEESSIMDEENTGTHIISEYNTDKDSYGYAIYGEFASLSSAPITVFTNAGAIKPTFLDVSIDMEAGTGGGATKSFVNFLSSSKNSEKYAHDEFGEGVSEKGSFILAAVTVRGEIDSYKNEMVYSYLFCTASSEFFSDELLSNASFANYDVLSGLIDNVSRIDRFASLEIGGESPNYDSYGGKKLVSTTLSELGNAETVFYAIIVFIPPIALAAYGTVRIIKRRYL